MLLIPMISAMLYLQYLGSALMLKLKKTNRFPGLRQALSFLFVTVNNEQMLMENGLGKISTVITFTNIIYLTLCKYSMAPLLCTEMPSLKGDSLIDPYTNKTQQHPRLALNAFPEMECWNGQHWAYVAMGGVGLVIYMLGLPLFILLILLYIRKHQLHTNRNILLAFGALYTKYEARSWWYEVIQVHCLPTLIQLPLGTKIDYTGPKAYCVCIPCCGNWIP